MNEARKAAIRRARDLSYQRYFVGDGIDVGCGAWGLNGLREFYPAMRSVVEWDLPMGDGALLASVADNTCDWVHGSHVLEHLDFPAKGMNNWLRVLKPGGHIIATIPDFEMYERGNWPSKFSGEHLWRFTMEASLAHGPQMLYLMDFLDYFESVAAIERIVVVRDNFNPSFSRDTDQTLGPAECAIEFVVRKLCPTIPKEEPSNDTGPIYPIKTYARSAS